MSAQPVKKSSVQEMGPPTGDPKAIALRLKAFGESVEYFNANHKALIEKYPERWIAIHLCEVVADAKTVRSLLKKTDALGKPRGGLLVEFLTRTPRKLIV